MATTNPPTEAARLRDLILEDPASVVGDAAVLSALIDATEGAAGANVIDLRGALLEQLQRRLVEVEATHRDVVTTAFENLGAAQQVQRAVLALIEPAEMGALGRCLAEVLPGILGVECLRLGVEVDVDGRTVLPLGRGAPAVVPLRPGATALYVGPGSGIALRAVGGAASDPFAFAAAGFGSEAVIPLEAGPRVGPALLVLGAAARERFHRGQGTDLLAFLGEAAARVLRRMAG